MLKEILVVGLTITIVFLHSNPCQQFTDDKNEIFEWYYNLNQQNYHLNLPRVKRQSRNNNFDDSDEDDDEWYVFDVVEPEQQPQPQPQPFQPQQPEENSNQFDWNPRQQQQQQFQPDSFQQFRPDDNTSPRPQLPNAGLPRPSRCVEQCNARTTSEYNPVCGTNGITYNSLAKLECSTRCGINVQIQRNGRCAPFIPPPPR